MQKYLVERREGLENEDLKSLDIQKEDIPEIKSAIIEAIQASKQDQKAIVLKILEDLEKGN